MGRIIRSYFALRILFFKFLSEENLENNRNAKENYQVIRKINNTIRNLTENITSSSTVSSSK